MTHPFNSRTRFTTWGLWILAVIMADQAIKATVEASMPLGTSIAITAGFNWVHAINPGAAFSFLADAGGWQRIFRGRGPDGQRDTGRVAMAGCLNPRRNGSLHPDHRGRHGQCD